MCNHMWKDGIYITPRQCKIPHGVDDADLEFEKNQRGPTATMDPTWCASAMNPKD